MTSIPLFNLYLLSSRQVNSIHSMIKVIFLNESLNIFIYLHQYFRPVDMCKSFYELQRCHNERKEWLIWFLDPYRLFRLFNLCLHQYSLYLICRSFFAPKDMHTRLHRQRSLPDLLFELSVVDRPLGYLTSKIQSKIFQLSKV